MFATVLALLTLVHEFGVVFAGDVLGPFGFLIVVVVLGPKFMD